MVPELGPAQPDPSKILLGEALSFAGAQGYTFNPIAQQWLEMFLSDAADRSVQTSRVQNASDLIKIIEDLQPLVQQFVALRLQSAKESGTIENIVEPSHLEVAKHRFCPLFPFC